ncbi:MAG: hypothetical protein ACP5JU_01920 [Minisyncoccia bacterium]
MKNKDKKLVEKAYEEIKKRDRYFGIILEDIRDKFELISEGYVSLNEKFEKRFAELEEEMHLRFNAIEKILQEHEKILKEHSKILQEHEKILKEHSKQISEIYKILERINKDIFDIKRDIEIMKADITTIKFELKRKVDYDEFIKLEKRVLALEKKIK